MSLTSEEEKEGSYWSQDSGEVINHLKPKTESELQAAPIRRLDWEERRPSNDILAKIKVFLAGMIHPVEYKVVDTLQSDAVKLLHSIDRVETFHPHRLAEVLNLRGYLDPLKPGELIRLSAAQARNLVFAINGEGLDTRKAFDKEHPDYSIAMKYQNELDRIAGLYTDGETGAAKKAFKEFKQDLAKFRVQKGSSYESYQFSENGPLFYLSKKIDLNRQFAKIPLDAKEWKDVFAAVTNEEARLLLKLLQDYPDLEYLFSMHEDNELGHEEGVPLKERTRRKGGFYVYDQVWDASTDTQKEFVKQLVGNLVTALKAEDFEVLNGYDDPSDPALRNFARNGYIYQSIKRQPGRKTPHSDGSFERAAVLLGGLGLTQIKRSFCFEIPMGLSDERKARMLQLIQQHLMLPFLAAQGIQPGVAGTTEEMASAPLADQPAR